MYHFPTAPSSIVTSFLKVRIFHLSSMFSYPVGRIISSCEIPYPVFSKSGKRVISKYPSVSLETLRQSSSKELSSCGICVCWTLFIVSKKFHFLNREYVFSKSSTIWKHSVITECFISQERIFISSLDPKQSFEYFIHYPFLRAAWNAGVVNELPDTWYSLASLTVIPTTPWTHELNSGIPP